MNKNHLLGLLACLLMTGCGALSPASGNSARYLGMSCAELDTHAKEARALRDAPQAEVLAHQHRHGLTGTNWSQELATIEAAQGSSRCSALAGTPRAQ